MENKVQTGWEKHSVEEYEKENYTRDGRKWAGGEAGLRGKWPKKEFHKERCGGWNTCQEAVKNQNLQEQKKETAKDRFGVREEKRLKIKGKQNHIKH